MPPKVIQIKDLAHLKEELAKLPEVAPGKKRLYRGQNKHREAMIPSKFRGDNFYNREDASWKLAGQVFVLDEMLAQKKTGKSTENSASLDLAIEGLIQHYGLRSGGLDVTEDMMVALWFAQFEHVEANTADTVYSEKNKMSGNFYFKKASYQRFDADFTYLYVFDCRVWQVGTSPVIGDCANLQKPFGSFACRPVRQKGWYIYSDNREGKKGDLREFIIAVYEIPRSLRPQPGDGWQEDVLYYFPPPAEDTIYEKMLKNFFIETAANNYERILKVPQYYSSVAEITRPDAEPTYTGLIAFTKYPEFFKALQSFPNLAKHAMQLGSETYFMADAELIKMRVPDWRLNHVLTYTPGNAYSPKIEDIEFPAEDIRFNYFIELAIYELVGQTDTYNDCLRAVWIVQQQEFIGIQPFFSKYDKVRNYNTLYYKKLPGKPVQLLIPGDGGDEALQDIYKRTLENALRVIQNEKRLVYFKKYTALKEFYGE